MRVFVEKIYGSELIQMHNVSELRNKYINKEEIKIKTLF